jgi:hypothetical protein
MKHLAFALALFLAGCATSSAPDGWLDNPGDLQHEAFGGWVDVQYRTVVQYQSARDTTSGNGELIAVHPDTLYVLSPFGTLTSLPRSAIVKARLSRYDANEEELGFWTFFGTASTISHGYALVFSAPIWFFTGLGAVVGQSRQPFLTYPTTSWDTLRRYARFPQGLPSGLDPETLQPKPVGK